jgi:hypothetical protein
VLKNDGRHLNGFPLSQWQLSFGDDGEILEFFQLRDSIGPIATSRRLCKVLSFISGNQTTFLTKRQLIVNSGQFSAFTVIQLGDSASRPDFVRTVSSVKIDL